MGAFDGTVCGGLAAIQKLCAQSALGLANSIYVVEAGDLASIPAPDASSHTISGDVVFDTPTTGMWFQWRIADVDAEFSAQSVGVAGSQSFQNTLTVFLPIARDASVYVMNQIINGEFVVIFGDKNGQKRILGTDSSPAMIPEGGIQEVNNSERNGITVTFQQVGHTPYFYDGAIDVSAV